MTTNDPTLRYRKASQDFVFVAPSRFKCGTLKASAKFYYNRGYKVQTWNGSRWVNYK